MAVSDIAPLRMALIWAARLMLYLGMFVGVGGRFFMAWIAPQETLPSRAARLVAASLAVGLAAAVLSLGLQGVDTLGLQVADLADPHSWGSGLRGPYAATLALAVMALVLAQISSRVASRAGRRLTTASAMLMVGLALAASGHASIEPPQPLLRAVVFVHAVTIAFWVGALVPLAAVLGADRARGSETLRRFSAIIPLPLIMLMTSGGALALVALGRVEALWTSAYGYILDGKMGAVSVLLILAGWNRYRLTPRLLAGSDTARASLRRSIALECFVMGLILALVAGWRFTPPPRFLVARADLPELHLHLHADRAMTDITITPGRVGSSSVAIFVLDGNLAPMEAKAVDLTLWNSPAGIEPIRRAAVHLDGPAWRIDHLAIPAPGSWTCRIDILVSDFAKVSLQGEFTIPP